MYMGSRQTLDASQKASLLVSGHRIVFPAGFLLFSQFCWKYWYDYHLIVSI